MQQYYSNENVTSLKKTIATVTEADHVCYCYAFIQYIFTDGEQTVFLRPHAKKTRQATSLTCAPRKVPWIKFKKNLSTHDPRKIVHHVRRSWRNLKSLVRKRYTEEPKTSV